MIYTVSYLDCVFVVVVVVVVVVVLVVVVVVVVVAYSVTDPLNSEMLKTDSGMNGIQCAQNKRNCILFVKLFVLVGRPGIVFFW